MEQVVPDRPQVGGSTHCGRCAAYHRKAVRRKSCSRRPQYRRRRSPSLRQGAKQTAGGTPGARPAQSRLARSPSVSVHLSCVRGSSVRFGLLLLGCLAGRRIASAFPWQLHEPTRSGASISCLVGIPACAAPQRAHCCGLACLCLAGSTPSIERHRLVPSVSSAGGGQLPPRSSNRALASFSLC